MHEMPFKTDEQTRDPRVKCLPLRNEFHAISNAAACFRLASVGLLATLKA